ncbi:HD-GYP domain-containing protein [Sphingomonas sp. RS2018]
MLVRLPVAQVQLGMFVHSIECSWLDNPFWRSRFLLEDAADLELLRQSKITEVTIDQSRSVMPKPAAAPDAETPEVAEPIVLVERRGGRRRTPKLKEIDRARETVERSKVAVTRMFSEARLGNAVQIAEVSPLVEEIAASMERDRSAMLNVTRLKTKNEYTYLHSVAVCALMMNLARQLGMTEDQVQQAGIAGLLHDIGKMAMPDTVLDKAGALDSDELRIIRSHPGAGHALLKKSAEVNEIALDVCLHHHERVDGGGYPFGLKGDELSVWARMGAICDVYDAITSVRPYKRPWSPNAALARMLEWEGHFDTRMLDTFIASIGIFPLGGVVRLHSGRLGLVIGCDEAAPTNPRVRAFYDIPTARFVPYEDITTLNAAPSDPILRTERGERWFGDRWQEIEAMVGNRDTIPAAGPPPRDRSRTPAPTLATARAAR